MNNESNCSDFRQQFKCFIDECQLPTQNLNSVQNVRHLRKQISARRFTAEFV